MREPSVITRGVDWRNWGYWVRFDKAHVFKRVTFYFCRLEEKTDLWFHLTIAWISKYYEGEPHTDTIFYFKLWICFRIKIYYIWQISNFYNSPIHVILKQCTVNSEVTHNSFCFVSSEITSWTAANLYSTQDTTVNISKFWNCRCSCNSNSNVILIAHFENVFF